MKVVVRRTNGSKPWYYRVVSRNGQVILVSEGYANKANAVRAARRYLALVDVDAPAVEIDNKFSVNKFQR